MKQLRDLHPDWRVPLMTCLGILLGTVLVGAWRWDKAAQAEAGHQELRLARLRVASELDTLRRDADKISQALALLKQLKKPVPDGQPIVIAPVLPPEARISEIPRSNGNGSWRERLIRLQTPLLHEEILLEMLGHWRDQSAIQHHLRSCRISRRASGLQADCLLAQLHWHANESP